MGLPLLRVDHLAGGDADTGIVSENQARFDTDKNDIFGRTVYNDIGGYLEPGRNWGVYSPGYPGAGQDHLDWNASKFTGAGSMVIEAADGQRGLAFPSAASGSFTATTTQNSNQLTNVSSLAGLALGQGISSANLPAGAYIFKMSGTTVWFAVAGKKPNGDGAVATGTGTNQTITAATAAPAASQMLSTTTSLLPTSGDFSLLLPVTVMTTPGAISYVYSTVTGPTGQRFAISVDGNMAVRATNLSAGGDTAQSGNAALTVGQRGLILFELSEGSPKVAKIGTRAIANMSTANWTNGVSASTGGEGIGSNQATIAHHHNYGRTYFPFSLSKKAGGQSLVDAVAAYYGIA